MKGKEASFLLHGNICHGHQLAKTSVGTCIPSIGKRLILQVTAISVCHGLSGAHGPLCTWETVPHIEKDTCMNCIFTSCSVAKSCLTLLQSHGL